MDYTTAKPAPTTADRPTDVFKPKGLTRKQAHFVKLLIDNPKMSPTRAAMEAYGKPGQDLAYGTAGQIAHENLKKPEIIMALGSHNDLFESAIVGVVQDWKDSPTPRKREIALDAAKYGHDKIHGKATTKVEQQTRIVNIAINLTGDGETPPRDFIEGDIADSKT